MCRKPFAARAVFANCCFAAASFAQPEMNVSTLAAGGSVTVDTMVTLVTDPTADYTVFPGSATINIAGGGVTDGRSIGFFDHGNITPGTLLNDAIEPAATFAGGIGMERGVCLCTGLLDDHEINVPPDDWGPTGIPPELNVGVQGPNNGAFINDPGLPPAPISGTSEGQISTRIQPGPTSELEEEITDQDFNNAYPDFPSGGDPAVLQFDVTLSKPGILSVRFAFGSDEYPVYIMQPYNDSLAILIKKHSAGSFNNLAKFAIPSGSTSIPPTMEGFSLQRLTAFLELD